MKNLRLLSVFLAFTALSTPAFALDSEAVNARLESLERNIMLLQRQVSREGVSEDAPTGGDVAVGNPQQENRISALEEQIRSLNGKLEESQFQNRRTAEALERFQKDVDFRFQQQQLPPAAPLVDTTPETPAKEAETPKPNPAPEAPKKPKENPEPVVKESTKADIKVIETKPAATAEAKPAADAQSFATAKEHYNYAFRLMNDTQYDDAATSFKGFLKKYPKDPLAGNANYWLGETYYIRKDYVGAADYFRQGFEASPNGPKAPDNLLKLAMSLSSLKHDKEACVVLGQVINKFGKTSTNTARKAENEQKRIGCK